MDDIRNSLNQYCDLIIELCNSVGQSRTWVGESKKLADQLWMQIEKRIDTGGDLEGMIAMTFLLNCLGKTIKKCLPSDQFDQIAEDIKNHLLKEMRNFSHQY
jgi:hypothetical protein